MPGFAKVAGVVVLVIALVGTTTVAIVQTRRVRQAQAEAAQLQADLAEAREQLARQEEERSQPAGGLEDLLGSLGGLFEGVLGELGGGLGGANGLAGLAPCLTGGGGGLAGILGGGDPVTAPDASGQIAEISDRVEGIRGHDFARELTPRFLDGEQIGRRVTDGLLRDYPAEEADLDQRILVALGAIPPGSDLRQLQAELLAGQIAGFYDSETGELIVRADNPGEPLGPVAQVTLAHELVHALTDQALGLPDGTLEGPTDQALAALALVEGDAVLAQQLFSLEAIALDQQLALASDPTITAAQESLERAPHYLRAQLEFPYLDGSGFVCGLELAGGWQAVDTAYRELPVTTAQILFPERYDAGEVAVDPRDPGAPGGGWTRARTDTFGAAQLAWLFEAPDGDESAALEDPRAAAGSWAGGEVHLYTRGPGSAVGVALVDRDAGGALCRAMEEWRDATFGDPGDPQVALRCDGRDVRLGVAPDAAAAEALAA